MGKSKLVIESEGEASCNVHLKVMENERGECEKEVENRPNGGK